MSVRRPCARPGCPKLVKRGYCDEHARGLHRAYDRHRGSARKRGYTPTWDEISKQYRRAHPMCEDCEERGETVPVDLVHHLDPVEEGNPVIVSWDRLRSLCNGCHKQWHAGAIG